MRHRFEVWLDDVLADEPAPNGIDADILDALQQDEAAPESTGTVNRDSDRATVVAAVTTLTQEVKLQGRTFKQLLDAMEPLIQDHQARHGATEDNPLLDVLLDMHAGLGRGLESCQQAGPPLEHVAQVACGGFWAALFGRRKRSDNKAQRIVAGLQEGYALTRQRATDALQEHGITPIECLGRPFDPHTMVAANVVQDNDHPVGTVLEVYQAGFLRNGQVLRAAKVKVVAAHDSHNQANDREVQHE